MAALLEGSVGILPPGALGVSFFHHLTAGSRRLEGDVLFLAQPGSASARVLAEHGRLTIADADGFHQLPLASLFQPDLLAAHGRGFLPEVILACPNPDQLLGVISILVAVLEQAYEAGELWSGPLPVPIVVLSSNGIYFQRLRQIYLEKIEESTLLGRLPDLWPHLMPQIVGRLVRGVTIQTGVREGSGAETIYRPGPRGITRLAGGDDVSRQRVARLLSAKGGWFEVAANSSATRLEFDKAMVNLVANLLGQIYAIDSEGHFTPLRLSEIMVAVHQDEIRELAGKVFQIGQAVRAYGPTEDFEGVFSRLLQSCYSHLEHIPSSVQWVALKLRCGTLTADLTSTETWLLDPLIRYARSAGLDDAAGYFEALRARLLARLAQVVRTARAAVA